MLGTVSSDAQDPSPAPASTTPDGIPTLEPAPRLEMHEFDAFRKKGTGSITGSLDDIATKAFGERAFHGSTIFLIPQTSYSHYVADQAREVWLHAKDVTVDRGVFPYLRKTTADDTSQFTFSALPVGSYLIFAELVDSKATTESPCIGTYPGFDGDGNPANVRVATYCYGKILHDYLFLSGTARVSDGASVSIKLDNNGEIVK